MKKLISIILCAILCASSAFALCFTDANGRSVELENPQSVVSLYDSYGAAWLAAGGELSGSIAENFAGEGLPEGVQNLGSITAPNLELLFKLEPDLVLLSGDVPSHKKLLPLLEDAGVSCAFFSTPDYTGYLEMMDLFCRITGRNELYAAQLERVQLPIEGMIAEAAALGKHPTALLIRANSSAVKCRSSESTVAGHILRDMGFVNLADGDSALCESISMESIIISDPDYIFVVLQGNSIEAAGENLAALTGNPAWNSLSAVREGRYYILDRDLFHYHPNERWPEAYAFILEILKGEK